MSPGSFGWALACAAAAAAGAASLRGRRNGVPAAAGALAFAAASFPHFEGLSLVGLLYGIGGAPSVSSLVLLGAWIAASAGAGNAIPRREIRPLAAVVVALATFLYPMALGLTRFDPYVLGYRNDDQAGWLLGALGLIGLLAAVRGRLLLVSAVAGAVAAWSAGLGESTNLWDYVLDPWLTLFALVWILRDLRFSTRSPGFRNS